MPDLFGINPGTLFGLMQIQQRQAEQGRFLDQLDADRRHQELLDELRATGGSGGYDDLDDSLDDDEEEENEAPAAAAGERPAPYFGPRVDVSSLDLPDLGAIPTPADGEALRTLIDPPNLLVVGGSEDDGWAAAAALQQHLGGALSGLRASGRHRDMPDMSRLLVGGPEDVIFVAELDTPSQELFRMLSRLLVPTVMPAKGESGATAGASTEPGAESAAEPAPDDGTRDDLRRPYAVTIGQGPSARDLVLPAPLYWIVGHSRSGKVPAGLTAWGGKLVIPSDVKRCPDCAEEIRAAARICRFCRHEFTGR